MEMRTDITVKLLAIGWLSLLLLSCAINHDVAVLDIDLSSKEERIYKVNLFSEKHYNYSKSTIQGPYCFLITDSLLRNQAALDSIDPKPKYGAQYYGRVSFSVVLPDTVIHRDEVIYRSNYSEAGILFGCFWLPMTIQSWDAEIKIHIKEIDPELVSGLKEPQLVIKLGLNSMK